MKPQNNFKDAASIWAASSLIVIWFAMIAAGAYSEGMNLFEFMDSFTLALNKPFAVTWTDRTPKFILIALVVYAGAITMYYSSRMNRRPGEEHGSAKWGNVHELDKRYKDKDPEKNIILTQNLRMSLNGRRHMRNLLQIVVGGSGAGKSRSVILPNLLLANASFIVTDPKGGATRS